MWKSKKIKTKVPLLIRTIAKLQCDDMSSCANCKCVCYNFKYNCKQCKKELYCSKLCQLQHLKVHQTTCQSFPIKQGNDLIFPKEGDKINIKTDWVIM